MNVFIFHGIEVIRKKIGYPWLKQELEASGHTVFIPAFPNPSQPILSEWFNYFERYQDQIDEQDDFSSVIASVFCLRWLF